MRQKIHSSASSRHVTAKIEQSELNHEHARMFARVGEYFDAVKSGSDKSRLLALVEKIRTQALVHCRTEETMLRLVGHPSLELQRRAHRLILHELVHFRKLMAAGHAVSYRELEHLFDTLIIHHVCEDIPHDLAETVH